MSCQPFSRFILADASRRCGEFVPSFRAFWLTINYIVYTINYAFEITGNFLFMDRRLSFRGLFAWKWRFEESSSEEVKVKVDKIVAFLEVLKTLYPSQWRDGAENPGDVELAE